MTLTSVPPICRVPVSGRARLWKTLYKKSYNGIHVRILLDIRLTNQHRQIGMSGSGARRRVPVSGRACLWKTLYQKIIMAFVSLTSIDKSECLVVAPAVNCESDFTDFSKKLQSYKKRLANHKCQGVRHTLRTPM